MLAFSCKFSAPVITVATTAKPMSVEELISVSALGCELGLSWFVLSPLDLAIVCARFWLWAYSLVLASGSLIFMARRLHNIIGFEKHDLEKNYLSEFAYVPVTRK